eukprot:764851-Hanusia_phi.AAC.8
MLPRPALSAICSPCLACRDSCGYIGHRSWRWGQRHPDAQAGWWEQRRTRMPESAAGLGVAFHAKPKVKEQAQVGISTLGLDGILYLLGIRDSEACTKVWRGRGGRERGRERSAGRKN